MLKKILFVVTFLFIFPNYSIANNDFKHGISIFGDLKYRKNFRYFDYVNARAPKRGLVRLATQGTFNSLNPYILKGIAPSGISYIYDSLMSSSGDEISSMYPLVAKGIKISNSGLDVTFLLNQNAKFSDGKKITADDVVFSFNILRSKGHPSYKVSYQDVKKVEKISKYRVRFTLKNNSNKKLPIIIASLPVLPQHYYQNREFDKTTSEVPVGSGPYLISQVDMGKMIKYSRNKNYWARSLPVNIGHYNFDNIQYDYYLDDKIMIESFKAGNFDVRQENVARNWANSYNISRVDQGEIIKKEIKHSNPSGMQTFILNLRNPQFQDINLRQALTYAFNFDWIRKHIFYGSYKRTNSYFANSEFSYNDNAKNKFKLPIFDKNGFGRVNLIAAKNILDRAGYKIVDGALISPITKKPVKIEFIIVSRSFEMIIAPFIDNLRKLGILANTKLVEENQYLLKLRNFNYDVIVIAFPPALIPGSNLLRYWHSSQADIVGSQNYSGLKDKSVDKMVSKIVAAKNKKELILLCQKFDKYMLENYYTIPQWYSNSYRILYTKHLKRPKRSPKYSLGFDTWWHKESQAQ